MTEIFPGRRERIFTTWIFTISFSTLAVVLMYTEFKDVLLNLFNSSYWVLAFTLPFLPRIFIIFKFYEAVNVQITEDERNTDEHRGLFLTLSGFSFSALFALVLATTSSSANTELLGLSIILMLVSFLMFYGAFTFEGFKYYRWQVDAIEIMTDSGKMSLLFSLLAAIYGTQIDSNIKLTCLLFFSIFWLVSFFMQFTARHSYLSSFK